MKNKTPETKKEYTAAEYLCPGDIDQVFDYVIEPVNKWIGRRYKSGDITRNYAIDIQDVLPRSRRILLAMEAAGVGERELIEWLENKEEIRTGVVRACLEDAAKQIELKLI